MSNATTVTARIEQIPKAIAERCLAEAIANGLLESGGYAGAIRWKLAQVYGQPSPAAPAPAAGAEDHS